MRVFCAVRHSNDPRFYYGGLWSGNFYPALRELGHEVIESQTDLLPASRFMYIPGAFTAQERAVRARITEEILDEVRTANRQRAVDLFLSYFYNAHFLPDGFDELRRLGIPSVNYYCNSVYQFELVRDVAKAADFAWHAEKPARDRYLQAGANPIWIQMAADPAVYHPVEGAQRKLAACFVGQRYADRDRWMVALLRAKVPVDIYGPGWGINHGMPRADQEVCNGDLDRVLLGRKVFPAGSPAIYWQAIQRNFREKGVMAGTVRTWRQLRYRRETIRLAPLFHSHARGAIPFQDIAYVFASYEICLNFSNVWADGRPGSRLIPHVRLRDFEGPMCRTCYLTAHTDEITEFYELGREIDTYSSPEELVDKTRYYLKHPGEGEKLRAAGYRRARRDHTWQQRFRQLFRGIGLRETA